MGDIAVNAMVSSEARSSGEEKDYPERKMKGLAERELELGNVNESRSWALKRVLAVVVGGGDEQDGELAVDDPRDLVDGDARGHQSDDPTAGVAHRHDRLHGGTQRARIGLGDGPAPLRRPRRARRPPPSAPANAPRNPSSAPSGDRSKSL